MGNPLKASGVDPHTKQKVAIYDAYLKRYLKIILHGSFSRVNIFDPFAGMGRYDNCDGSAVVACNNIAAHKECFPDKELYLFLNDSSPENLEILRASCCQDFVQCICDEDAEDFIRNRLEEEHSGHKLWFLDPYGYTQVKRSSISNIMNQQNSEVLLFIPTSHIYRFLKGCLQDSNLRSIANFLKDYSIEEQQAKNCSSAPEFADLISKTLQGLYNYSWHATMQDRANHYSLVFIGSHYYGLEKFLEARDAILKDPKQHHLSLIPVGKERDLLQLLPKNKPINNCELYLLGLNNGFSPSSMQRLLKSLDEKNEIVVRGVDNFRPRKGSYYIAKKYFSNKETKIQITVKIKQNLLF